MFLMVSPITPQKIYPFDIFEIYHLQKPNIKFTGPMADTALCPTNALMAIGKCGSEM
jgi:hypothetical protein